jgi:hypothetical protein
VRLLVVATVCLAIGFGAGWTVFARPWEADDEPDRFTLESVEHRARIALGRRIRDVSCESAHGPFYSCRAYSAVNTGADYELTVAHSGRCLTATRDDPSTEDELLDNLDPDAFERDPALPVQFRAWLTTRADC